MHDGQISCKHLPYPLHFSTTNRGADHCLLACLDNCEGVLPNSLICDSVARRSRSSTIASRSTAPCTLEPRQDHQSKVGALIYAPPCGRPCLARVVRIKRRNVRACVAGNKYATPMHGHGTERAFELHGSATAERMRRRPLRTSYVR
eukprot:578012-Pleurochrysis_carterae.AAC.2